MHLFMRHFQPDPHGFSASLSWKVRPPRPTRFCTEKIGPGEVQATFTALARRIGQTTSLPKPVRKTSRRCFALIAGYF